MVRIGDEAAQRALELDHVREMDFTGRPMKNMIFVQPAGLQGRALERWITAAADYARTLARACEPSSCTGKTGGRPAAASRELRSGSGTVSASAIRNIRSLRGRDLPVSTKDR
jgi:hypothetical protein